RRALRTDARARAARAGRRRRPAADQDQGRQTGVSVRRPGRARAGRRHHRGVDRRVGLGRQRADSSLHSVARPGCAWSGQPVAFLDDRVERPSCGRHHDGDGQLHAAVRSSPVARALLAALGVLVLAQNPPGQPPPVQPPGGQQPPVFRGGTANVRVDVTVIDHKGNPVTDLTKDDFDVREDGVPQVVDTLKMIRATGEAPDDDTSLPIRSPEHAAVEAAPDAIRVFVIVWDESHIGQSLPAMRARDALNQFVQTAFGPTDLVALMDQLTPADAIRFTRDRRELAEKVRLLRGRQGLYVPARSAVEEAQLYQGRDVEVLRAQVTATALESTIAFLGQIKEGRKTILFVSQTIGRLGPTMTDTIEWLDNAIRLANADNTTIYTLDPRGLDLNVRTSDILKSLAENTGGRQFSNNSPALSLREIVREASAFYLLGYRSEKNPSDGKFHKIAVHVKRPGVDVKSRTGYYAPSAAEMDNARR